MIEELCRKIKEKRKELGYSIEDVVKKTKLHPGVVRDIEACNLNSITPVFLKGFIKIYASFLGIEIKDELSQIQTGTGPRTVKKPQDKKELKKGIFAKFFKAVSDLFLKIPVRLKRGVLLGAVLLVVFWFGFLGVRFSFRKVMGFFRSRTQVEEKQPVAEEKPPTALVGRIDQVRASLTARRPCYVKVFIDGEVFFEGVLGQGEVKNWRAENRLELQIRDGSAVDLEVDGEAIPRLSSLRRRKKVIIDSSGITIE